LENAPGWQVVGMHNSRDEEEREKTVLSGDPSALLPLLQSHEGALLALCRRMLGHAEDAEDAVQETFLRAIRNLHHFQHKSQLRSWLYRIAVNICIDKRRRQRPESPLEEALLQTSHASAETEALAGLRLEQALQQLSGRRRAIFLLKEVEGWTAAEIAETLRCRTSLVYYELREAFQILSRILGSDESL
jgi:RNA polymerase sigma-70 factor (ECF subfamily)